MDSAIASGIASDASPRGPRRQRASVAEPARATNRRMFPRARRVAALDQEARRLDRPLGVPVRPAAAGEPGPGGLRPDPAIRARHGRSDRTCSSIRRVPPGRSTRRTSPRPARRVVDAAEHEPAHHGVEGGGAERQGLGPGLDEPRAGRAAAGAAERNPARDRLLTEPGREQRQVPARCRSRGRARASRPRRRASAASARAPSTRASARSRRRARGSARSRARGVGRPRRPAPRWRGGTARRSGQFGRRCDWTWRYMPATLSGEHVLVAAPALVLGELHGLDDLLLALALAGQAASPRRGAPPCTPGTRARRPSCRPGRGRGRARRSPSPRRAGATRSSPRCRRPASRGTRPTSPG